MEGSGRDLIWDTFRHSCGGTHESHENLCDGYQYLWWDSNQGDPNTSLKYCRVSQIARSTCVTNLLYNIS
jgi:hypothetical protein